METGHQQHMSTEPSAVVPGVRWVYVLGQEHGTMVKSKCLLLLLKDSFMLSWDLQVLHLEEGPSGFRCFF